MTSEADEGFEHLIDSTRFKLKGKIAVEQVLPYLHFLDQECKDRIKQKSITDGDIAAADLLLSTVIERPHKQGWFWAFIDALAHGGSELAADYLTKPPKPEEEAENDTCVELIRLLAPSLSEMKTTVVCGACYSAELLTVDDNEKILAVTNNEGNRRGAQELLKRIIRRRPPWFSQFLQVLRDAEEDKVYRELTGSGINEEASAPKQEPAQSEPVGEENSEAKERNGIQEIQEEPADLYLDPDLPQSEERSQPDGSASAAAAGEASSPEKPEISLWDYQMEVAKPALEGKNIIICLPTGSGKTRVAVYITKEHLDSRKAEGKPGKVVILVNKVPLVEQHHSKEFTPYLKHLYKVERVSGDSQLKISFAKTVQRNDIIICTAQILENYLEIANSGVDEGVKLSDLSLMIIDECHHTQKGEAYNHIMMRYLKQKHKNKKLQKEQKETVPLPQILGLTASPGVGRATKLEKAKEHILRICANLDASQIMTRSLGDFKREPRKAIQTVEDRKQDPFGDVIKRIMHEIHLHAQLNPTGDLGTQVYEQWSVQKERQAAKEGDQKVRVCAEYLRQYNNGLMRCNILRMQDALSFLKNYHEEQNKKKSSPDEEQNIQITDTERFLFKLFNENEKELADLAKNPEYENDSLSKLRTIILKEFSSRKQATGIIFTKTRHSAIALNQWIQENSKFDDIGIKSAYLIGGGDQSDVKPMTAAEQKDVLKKFSTGEVNLLVATTVAEEGLDIPKCNFVIRYGHVTNEIAMIQSQGRGRAEDSSYTVVDVKNSGVAERECVNEHREDMMHKAIEKIKALSPQDYDKQITEYQLQAIMEKRVREHRQNKKVIKNESPSAVKFSCRHCNKQVCTGEEINIIGDMHRVNSTVEFKKLFIQRENSSLLERLVDYETNGIIACKDCGQSWGSMMMFRGIELPCLHVKNFVVNINGKNISNCTKWSDIPVKFPAFDYSDYASRMEIDSDEETI
ncbi:interferon-induced helicase C domain-containing protein 1 isoform X2 [Oryzias melastigma]|uniref:RNA helicase n=1 Tax=Oryzias melastigma TaxID=30732 RepID=A0A3B3CY96_ORYME|nr:interferon-induced helicase C domain-containing protein 1 isoform X2 [Oryzias melastigma]